MGEHPCQATRCAEYGCAVPAVHQRHRGHCLWHGCPHEGRPDTMCCRLASMAAPMGAYAEKAAGQTKRKIRKRNQPETGNAVRNLSVDGLPDFHALRLSRQQAASQTEHPCRVACRMETHCAFRAEAHSRRCAFQGSFYHLPAPADVLGLCPDFFIVRHYLMEAVVHDRMRPAVIIHFVQQHGACFLLFRQLRQCSP